MYIVQILFIEILSILHLWFQSSAADLLYMGRPGRVYSAKVNQYCCFFRSKSQNIWNCSVIDLLQTWLSVRYHFPTYRRILTPLQRRTFENIVTKEEISPFSQSFQLYSIIIFSLTEMFHIFIAMFSKWSAAGLMYVGKG